jgi:holliday junction DNA helicase RuvA
MIAFLAGRIIAFVETKMVLRTASGIGYLVTFNPQKRYMINENVEIFVLHVIREDKEELYAFDSIEDRDWVENLLKVNGVGPKMAAIIVYSMGVDRIKYALDQKDIEAFCGVKGLGKKTAQKIVLELKGAVVDLEQVVSQLDTGDFTINFTEAMGNLGYKRGEVVATISVLKKEKLWDTEDLMSTIRRGLSLLGK